MNYVTAFTFYTCISGDICVLCFRFCVCTCVSTRTCMFMYVYVEVFLFLCVFYLPVYVAVFLYVCVLTVTTEYPIPNSSLQSLHSSYL